MRCCLGMVADGEGPDCMVLFRLLFLLDGLSGPSEVLVLACHKHRGGHEVQRDVGVGADCLGGGRVVDV